MYTQGATITTNNSSSVPRDYTKPFFIIIRSLTNPILINVSTLSVLRRCVKIFHLEQIDTQPSEIEWKANKTSIDISDFCGVQLAPLRRDELGGSLRPAVACI